MPELVVPDRLRGKPDSIATWVVSRKPNEVDTPKVKRNSVTAIARMVEAPYQFSQRLGIRRMH